VFDTSNQCHTSDALCMPRRRARQRRWLPLSAAHTSAAARRRGSRTVRSAAGLPLGDATYEPMRDGDDLGAVPGRRPPTCLEEVRVDGNGAGRRVDQQERIADELRVRGAVGWIEALPRKRPRVEVDERVERSDASGQQAELVGNRVVAVDERATQRSGVGHGRIHEDMVPRGCDNIAVGGGRCGGWRPPGGGRSVPGAAPARPRPVRQPGA